MNEKTFILTKTDTGCARSWTITEFDTEMIVPCENKTYQYLIAAKNDFAEQIIATRILEEFYQEHVKDCNIRILNIPLSKRMRLLLKLLAADNVIEVKSFSR
jgi:hypothetical protein